MQKLWAGRFSETANASLEEFWNSIAFDCKLAQYDIEGSLAHVSMLATTGIISKEESEQISKGLRSILEDVAAGKIEFSMRDEDIHMNVERILHERVGAVAGKLHTARSRNDQVALDMHLYVREQCVRTVELLQALQQALLAQAENAKGLIIPGYTHLQRAQPVLFAHHLLAYCWMLQRDIDRVIDCRKRANLSPLGAGALAGTTFPIDRLQVARELNFAGVYENSMDAVGDRDFVAEMLFVNALIAAHLSRFCEEIVIWATSEFGFIEISDGYSSGSSMMPQKKNPDLAELVRGKTGRVYGALMGMLTVLKGVPLTYNKDFQEDKEGLFDSVSTVQLSLFHLTGMVGAMKPRPKNAARASAAGFLNATDLADYLAKREVPFREAHEIVGKLVLHCLKEETELEQLSLETLKSFSPKIEKDVYEALELEVVVNRRDSYGGTSGKRVGDQMVKLREKLLDTGRWLTENRK